MVLHTNPRQQLFRTDHSFFPAPPQNFLLGKAKVIKNRHVRIKLEMLENHADTRPQRGQVGPLGGHLVTVHGNLALLHRLQPVDAFDQSRFTRSGRAADHDHLPFADACRAVAQHAKIAIPLADVFDTDHVLIRDLRLLTNIEPEKHITK